LPSIKKKNRYMENLVKIKEEQLNLANQLYQKFDNIEQESGIFLIKPKLSYFGKYVCCLTNLKFK